MNALADAVLTYLLTKHTRVYRNRAEKDAVVPYVVFSLTSAIDTYPSNDYALNITCFDNVGSSVRTIEDLADAIDAGLNLKVVSNASINAHFVKEIRQWSNDTELSGRQLVNLQYVVRTYRK